MRLLDKVKYIFTFVCLIFMYSCEDELYQEPISAVSSINFYSNEREIETAVTGVYSTLMSSNLYGLYLPAIGEVPSDNSTEESEGGDGGNYFQLEGFTVMPVNSIIAGVWKDSYEGIQRANVVLNRISDIEFENEATKEARIGEMKFIRALLYFNLVRIYGDIPLVITEITDPADGFGFGRAPLNEVYTQIEKDLTEAIDGLPVTGSDNSRVTRGAAQGLLGKVYLTRNNYTDAKTQLSAVVNSGKYSLLADVNDIFGIENENNSEYVFAVQFFSNLDGNTQGSPSYFAFTPVGFNGGRFGHNLPTPELLSLYDPSDERLTAYYKRGENTDGNGNVSYSEYYTAKLSYNESIPEDGGSDWIVLRYSDIILMLAEVENELGNPAPATTLLNSIRTRAGLLESTATSQSELRDAISLERRLELSIEGHRWFDLLRTGKAIEVMGNSYTTTFPTGIVVTADELLFPIPQNQLDTDPSLIQNPGY